MQGGIWCRGHFLPGAAGAGVQSSSARRGRSEPSSTVVPAPQCVGNATVDCRNRRFGLIRLNRSESAWLARGRRRVETQIRVNASSLRGIRPATGCRKQPQSRIPLDPKRFIPAHSLTRVRSEFFCISAEPALGKACSALRGSTIGEDSRLTYALFEIPHQPPEAAQLLEPGTLTN